MSLPSSNSSASTLVWTVKAFLSWWGRELAAVMRLNDGIGRSGRLLMIAFEASEAVILHRNKKVWTERGKIPLTGSGNAESARQTFDSATGAVMRSDTPIILRLPAKHGLQRILEFPLAAEGDLRKILENQMGRVTPYRADQVYFDYRVLEREPARDKLHVQLIASPREVVDSARTRLESWGTRADFLDLGEPDEPAVHMIDLSERKSDGEQVRARSWLTGALVLANLVLVAVVLGIPLMQKAEFETDLRQQVATMRMKADAAAKLRTKVDRIRAESTFLRDQKRASTRAIVVLDEVTKVMPDGTWLEHIKFRNGVVQLYGYSPRAATLIGITERSSMFQNVQFRAPVTRQDPHRAEQFHISADLLTKVKK